MVGGGGDQASSAVGNGIVEEGVVSCTLGTSGVVFAHMEKVAYDPAGRVHTFCHAVRDKWHVMGVTQGAGLSLQWFRNQLAPGTHYDALTAEAAHRPRGRAGPLLAPLPDGRAHAAPGCHRARRLDRPHQQPSARRPDPGGDRRRLLQPARLPGNRRVPGRDADSVRASGGGAKSPFWRGLLAAILDKRVVTLETQEGSAYGAALLALAGTGEYASVPEVCRVAIRETESVSPGAGKPRYYAKAHRVYQALYPALKPIYGQIAAL